MKTREKDAWLYYDGFTCVLAFVKAPPRPYPQNHWGDSPAWNSDSPTQVAVPERLCARFIRRAKKAPVRVRLTLTPLPRRSRHTKNVIRVAAHSVGFWLLCEERKHRIPGLGPSWRTAVCKVGFGRVVGRGIERGQRFQVAIREVAA